jgi:hypothetical protein
VGNSKYYGYTVSNNGVAEHHGNDYYQDYFTDYLANKSVAFVQKVQGPFFVMIGTPASHIPDDYAPWTEDLFNGTKALRTLNFNSCPNPDKHAMMRQIMPMQVGDPSVDGMDNMYASDWVHIKRLRTLQVDGLKHDCVLFPCFSLRGFDSPIPLPTYPLYGINYHHGMPRSFPKSVDVMVERLVKAVDERGPDQLANTFFLLSSDNGYHLGQFGLAYDKRQPYEEDIRVPLVVRGPGIASGSTTGLLCGHIDLAPTILDMMGVDASVVAPQMDGNSWLGVLKQHQHQHQQHQQHQHQHQQQQVLVEEIAATWRTEILIEYNGPTFKGSGNANDSAVRASGHLLDQLEVDVDEDGLLFDMLGVSPPSVAGAGLSSALVGSGGSCKWFSKASTAECDPSSNTYACVRSIGSAIDADSGAIVRAAKRFFLV